MNIHEFQAKKIFHDFGVPTTSGHVVRSLAEISGALSHFRGTSVVKAQIHAGGRGKGVFPDSNLPGVFIAKTQKDASEYIQQTLGRCLVTKQTGEKGRVVNAIYLCDVVAIKKEYYLALLIDRNHGLPVFVASSAGGGDVEDRMSHGNSGQFFRLFIEPEFGLYGYQVRTLARQLGLEGDLVPQFSKILFKMYKMFLEKDCSLIEINPLALTDEGKLCAVDAKISFDDNALYRHPELEALRDFAEEDELELYATSCGLNYVAVDGTIACIVNGAGLAMATMDIIKHYGGEPANFLDLGGRAEKQQIRQAVDITTKNTKVKGIFVNVFGGIAQCDVIAAGIVDGFSEASTKLPMVVRLEGAKAEEGRRLLMESNLPVIIENDLDIAVRGIVKIVK